MDKTSVITISSLASFIILGIVKIIFGKFKMSCTLNGRFGSSTPTNSVDNDVPNRDT